jgi:hypothetical protein
MRRLICFRTFAAVGRLAERKDVADVMRRAVLLPEEQWHRFYPGP